MSMRCPVCGQEFATDEDARSHDHEMPIAWAHSGAGFDCPVCGASFDEQEELVAHQGAAHAGGVDPPDDADRAEPR